LAVWLFLLLVLLLWAWDRGFLARYAAETWALVALVLLVTVVYDVQDYRRNKQHRAGQSTRARKPHLARPKKQPSPEDIEAKKAKNREYQRRFRERHPGYGTEMMRRWRASHPAEYAARKARQRGAEQVELVQPLEIFERDNWTCHICGGPVEMADASLDHIQPIARGGDHTAANLACSHRMCNFVKGDREPAPCASCGEQVMPGAARCRACGYPQTR
jgi:5-methylcytosine-specific restriction endonuclease McrA